MINKALSITQALYPKYALLFLFDNMTSHSVYAQDALQAKGMNKDLGKKQLVLQNSWFDCENIL